MVGEVKRVPTKGDVIDFDTDTTRLVRRRRGNVLRVIFCTYSPSTLKGGGISA